MAERPEDSSAEITIKAASIDTGTADRDRHLRSPDFLDVDRFPDLRFRSTMVEFPGDDRIALTGDLTIRDVTKSVVLDAEFTGMSQDPWGNPRAGYSASTQIDREDFGGSWNVALEAGGLARVEDGADRGRRPDHAQGGRDTVVTRNATSELSRRPGR